MFLFITGLQSLRARAKLALFTNKLCIALLLAALVRVHDGWPAILKGLWVPAVHSPVSDMWHDLSLLGFYVAPLAFLAANFGHRSQSRNQVAVTALMGIALPLFGTLSFACIIGVATYHSRFYTPSLPPNVNMALWGGVAPSAEPGPMMLAMITMFGAVRFGVRALADCISVRALLAPLIGVIVWASLSSNEPNFQAALEASARCLAVAGAVLTADFVTRKWRSERARRFDWVGMAALIGGLTVPLYLSPWMVEAAADPWWHPWLLPSYAVGFLACLFGRAVRGMIQNVMTRRASSA